MFKIADKIQVHDRKLKTNSFIGEIISIEETIEKARIYTVQVVVLDTENKKTGKKQVLNLLEDQFVKHIEPKKKKGKKKDVQV